MKKFVWVYEPLVARDHPGYGFNEGVVRLRIMKKFVWVYEPLIARDDPGYGFNKGVVRL
jgi:hypothetical protein